ncbi:MAG: IS1595 family transposase [Dehalococcoidia bacterium]
MKQKHYTIRDFSRDFPNDDACLEWLKNTRWPNGIYCTKCQRITKHHKISNRSAYACDFCGNHVYPMAGTILEHSATALRLWFHAMFLMASTRCGISAKQLQRELGVTYKTAWRMFTQIRSMLDEDLMSLLQEVEVDETYIGGRRRGKRGRGAKGKTPVFGMAQRNGNVIAVIVPDVKSKTLVPIVKEKILPSSIVYTDEFPSYNSLRRLGYKHKRVHHQSKVYVMGDAHTNTIEGFWSVVKRGIDGVHHAVSAKYLQDYINSYSFRWNHRDDETPMFLQILSRLVPALEV